MTLLYLDFDGAVPKGLIDRVTWMCKLWRWPIIAVRFDKTRHGWHVIIGVRKKLAPPLIVAAQAVLGSDPKREAFNIMRVQNLDALSPYWRERWNVLYFIHAKPER